MHSDIASCRYSYGTLNCVKFVEQDWLVKMYIHCSKVIFRSYIGLSETLPLITLISPF